MGSIPEQSPHPQLAVNARRTPGTSFVWRNGIRHARALHTSNRRLAEQLDRQHRDELIEREFQQPQFNPSLTFSELYIRFLAEGDVKPCS
jgi:hypothetical protein